MNVIIVLYSSVLLPLIVCSCPGDLDGAAAQSLIPAPSAHALGIPGRDIKANTRPITLRGLAKLFTSPHVDYQ